MHRRRHNHNQTQVKITTDKYSIEIFVEIKGAFDRVWWPNIMNAFREIRCPRNLYILIKSYLADRDVTVIDQENQITRPQNRSCPQGSVLGPILWDIVFDYLLDSLSEFEHCHPIAYADDLAIVISDNSRTQLEHRA